MPSSHETIALHAVESEVVEASLIDPDVSMLLLTWVVFFLLLGILYKFAWKPILAALDNREESIRKSLDDVDRIQKEMDQLDQRCKAILAQAEQKASNLIDQSRKAAKEAAHIIELKAREEAKISLENALRDIAEETQKAQARLRKESADIAVELAGKIIEENMNTDKSRALIQRYVKTI